MTSKLSSDQTSNLSQDHPLAMIVMGVAGSGKTSVGQALSARLNWSFVEGDEHHPPANVAKMSAGQPLTDQDRLPWLVTLNEILQHHQREGQPVILACSALKESYRQILTSGIQHTIIVYLTGSSDLIRDRLQRRPDHFMKASLLESQFEDLEPPVSAVEFDISHSLEKITAEIVKELPESP